MSASWSQYDAVNEGFNQGRAENDIDAQTLVTSMLVLAMRTRFEPWVLLSGDVKLELCRLMLSLLHKERAGTTLHVVMRHETRNLGAYSAGSIAPAIREASPCDAGFLGFDLPMAAPVAERSASVGGVVDATMAL